MDASVALDGSAAEIDHSRKAPAKQAIAEAR